MAENVSDCFFYAGIGLAGQRLDKALSLHWPDFSRAFFQQCLEEGRVKVNGRTVSQPSSRLKAGDCVEMEWPPPKDDKLIAQDIPLDIIYEDEAVIVINKPAGLVVHPGSGQADGTLVNALLNYDAEAFERMEDENQRPGIVHRLDGDTSGVMVIARTPDVQQKLAADFKEHEVHKTYLTLVWGTFDCLAGTVEKPIGRDPHQRQRMAVVSDGGKYALTRFKVLKSGERCSLLAVRIFTGRTHQIRVHLNSIGHPVLGDKVYGSHRQLAGDMPLRQMLHAWKLAFRHPVTGEKMEFVAPLPEDFRATAENLLGAEWNQFLI